MDSPRKPGEIVVGEGTPLGQPAPRFPGLAPVAHRLAALQGEVAGLEAQAWELGAIRATLLLNFGATAPNPYGVQVSDDGSTLELLLTVLRQIAVARPAGAVPPQAPEREAK